MHVSFFAYHRIWHCFLFVWWNICLLYEVLRQMKCILLMYSVRTAKQMRTCMLYMHLLYSVTLLAQMTNALRTWLSNAPEWQPLAALERKVIIAGCYYVVSFIPTNPLLWCIWTRSTGDRWRLHSMKAALSFADMTHSCWDAPHVPSTVRDTQTQHTFIQILYSLHVSIAVVELGQTNTVKWGN